MQGGDIIRTLTGTLTAAQKSMGPALYKVSFTKTGQTTRTYGCDTTNRILRLTHPESEWSQTAQILVDNRDGNLTALDLTGYLATISYGYNTSAGDEYSACAPLEVISQQGNTQLRQGELGTVFSCAGIFNLMGEDEASEEFAPVSTNTDTVKTILTAIAGATMPCFSHCKAYTITYDSEDSLIDSFKPADYFRVGFRESRLSVFKRALSWTRCKARIENTSDTATIHVFLPKPYATNWVANTVYALNARVTPTTSNGFEYICTTAGTSGATEPTWTLTESSTVTDNSAVWTIRWYDYEYNDAVTEHNFFEKSVRNRVVIPNRVYVTTHPSIQPPFTGNAVDSASYTALGRYMNQYHWLRVTSNAQCTLVATAILQKYQIGQEKGSGYAPLNCGQEVMDYVKITDSVANDTRVGNIGYINRICEPGKFEFQFSFGDPGMGGVAGLLPIISESMSLEQKVSLLEFAYDGLASIVTQMQEVDDVMSQNIKSLWALWDRDTVPYWHITDIAIAPVKRIS